MVARQRNPARVERETHAPVHGSYSKREDCLTGGLRHSEEHRLSILIGLRRLRRGRTGPLGKSFPFPKGIAIFFSPRLPAKGSKVGPGRLVLKREATPLKNCLFSFYPEADFSSFPRILQF